MINFSLISQNSIIGKILRFLLKFIPPNSQVFILQGRLRGRRWIKGSGVNGYWLGTYELEKQRFFEKIVKRGDIVFDVGAHVGFYTLLASELVGKTGKVFAFEPLPRNINYLKKHININKCKNITIIENALSNKSGNSFFKINSSSSTGQITNKEGLKIISATIDNLVFKNKLPVPHSLKIDVEGAELSVLRGAINTLKKYYPAIFLSTHSSEINKHCRNLLSGLGYNLKSISGNSIEKTNEIFAYKK